LHHAHENTDGLRCANQSLNGITCIFKVNTGCFEKSMELVVVDKAQRSCEPDQVPLTTHMMTFHG
jgi:hypothetical protein